MNRFGIVFTGLMLYCLSIGTISTASVSVNKPLYKIEVKDVFGKVHHPLALDGKKASVLIFIQHDCSICNYYVPTINRLDKEFAHRGVKFYVVYVENDMNQKEAIHHTKAYGYLCPALWDKAHVLVNLTHAKITPDVVVYTAGDKLSYRGRIDNLFAGIGVQRPKATKHDLQSALEEIVSGKKIVHPITLAVGCYMPGVTS